MRFTRGSGQLMEGTSDGFSSLPAWATLKPGSFVGHTGSLGATGRPPPRQCLLVHFEVQAPHPENGLKMQV